MSDVPKENDPEPIVNSTSNSFRTQTPIKDIVSIIVDNNGEYFIGKVSPYSSFIEPTPNVFGLHSFIKELCNNLYALELENQLLRERLHE
jgi:hypothetical protein